MATVSETPERTRFRTPERRRSWKTFPDSLAFRQAVRQAAMKFLDRLRLKLALGGQGFPEKDIFAFRIGPLLEDHLIPETIIEFPGQVDDPGLPVLRVTGVQGDLPFKDVTCSHRRLSTSRFRIPVRYPMVRTGFR